MADMDLPDFDSVSEEQNNKI